MGKFELKVLSGLYEFEIFLQWNYMIDGQNVPINFSSLKKTCLLIITFLSMALFAIEMINPKGKFFSDLHTDLLFCLSNMLEIPMDILHL